MLEMTKQFLRRGFRKVLLWGYGWKPRKTIYLGEPVTQWRDPMSYVWVSEKAAMKLLRVNVMDEYDRR